MAKIPNPIREFKIVRAATPEGGERSVENFLAELNVLGEKGYEVLAVPSLPAGWIMLSRAIGIQWLYVDEPSQVTGAQMVATPPILRP